MENEESQASHFMCAWTINMDAINMDLVKQEYQSELKNVWLQFGGIHTETLTERAFNHFRTRP